MFPLARMFTMTSSLCWYAGADQLPLQFHVCGVVTLVVRESELYTYSSDFES